MKNIGRYTKEQINNFDKNYLDTSYELKKSTSVDYFGDLPQLTKAADDEVPLNKPNN